jgi:hypothetical protein
MLSGEKQRERVLWYEEEEQYLKEATALGQDLRNAY